MNVCGSYVLSLIIFYICVKQLELNESLGNVFVVEQGSYIGKNNNKVDSIETGRI